MTETRPKRPLAVLRWLGTENRLGHIVFPVGAVAMLSVPAVLAYQFIQWWDSGHWPPISVADALGWYGMTAPRFEMPVVQQANEQLLESPLSLALLVIIGGSLYVYALIGKWLAQYAEPPPDDD